MKSCSNHIHWQHKPPYSVSSLLQRVLPTTGLLTLKLTVQCGSPLNVTILNEGLGLALADEARHLALAEPSEGWVRTVLLNCHQKPMLYARSFVPFDSQDERHRFLTNQHPFSDLKNIGQQPLGIWLSQHPELERTPFEFALTPAQHWPHWQLQPKLQLATRRSCFTRQHGRLLLSEVFLCDD